MDKYILLEPDFLLIHLKNSLTLRFQLMSKEQLIYFGRHPMMQSILSSIMVTEPFKKIMTFN